VISVLSCGLPFGGLVASTRRVRRTTTAWLTANAYPLWRPCRLLDAVYDYYNVYEAIISIIESSRAVSKRENGSYGNRVLNDAQDTSVDLLSK
jgi:hypothetical protein